jgi:hypothetical protein
VVVYDAADYLCDVLDQISRETLVRCAQHGRAAAYYTHMHVVLMTVIGLLTSAATVISAFTVNKSSSDGTGVNPTSIAATVSTGVAAFLTGVYSRLSPQEKSESHERASSEYERLRTDMAADRALQLSSNRTYASLAAYVQHIRNVYTRMQEQAPGMPTMMPGAKEEEPLAVRSWQELRVIAGEPEPPSSPASPSSSEGQFAVTPVGPVASAPTLFLDARLPPPFLLASQPERPHYPAFFGPRSPAPSLEMVHPPPLQQPPSTQQPPQQQQTSSTQPPQLLQLEQPRFPVVFGPRTPALLPSAPSQDLGGDASTSHLHASPSYLPLSFASSSDRLSLSVTSDHQLSDRLPLLQQPQALWSGGDSAARQVQLLVATAKLRRQSAVEEDRRRRQSVDEEERRRRQSVDEEERLHRQSIAEDASTRGRMSVMLSKMPEAFNPRQAGAVARRRSYMHDQDARLRRAHSSADALAEALGSQELPPHQPQSYIPFQAAAAQQPPLLAAAAQQPRRTADSAPSNTVPSVTTSDISFAATSNAVHRSQEGGRRRYGGHGGPHVKRRSQAPAFHSTGDLHQDQR